MRILFFSRLIPEKYESIIQSKIKEGMYVSGSAFQNKIIESIELNINRSSGDSLTLFNVLPVGSFPNRYSDKFINSFEFNHSSNQTDLDFNIGFNNTRIIKQFDIHFNLKKKIKSILNKENYDAVIFYSADINFILMFKLFKQTNVILIIPDLPEFNNVGNISIFQKIYQKLIKYIFNIQLKFVDGLVVLTEQTVEYLNWNKPYAVVEGISSYSVPDCQLNNIIYKNYMLYTGTTHECYGIKDAVKAFLKLNDKNYKFIICGSGDSDEWLKEISKRHKNLIYLGVQKHEYVIDLQKHADVLINPRKNVGEFTKYSFPSKIMEYLACGKTTIAYHLDGIPEQYFEFVKTPNDDTIQSLSDTMREVFLLTEEERAIFGRKAQDFVLNEKNPKIQGKKFIKLICELER